MKEKNKESTRMNVWTVDAFTSEVFSGNPAAVIVLDHFLSDELCQKIASELNLSETAFVKTEGEGQFHIRWFTPAVEVKLCGHATLAAAHILYQVKQVKSGTLEFKSLSGPLKVYKADGKLTLDFPLQQCGQALNAEPYRQVLGSVVTSVVQAYDDIIIELTDEKAVKELKVNAKQLLQFECRGVIVTAKGSGHYDLSPVFLRRAWVWMKIP